jgi:hypothetical protein
VSTFFLQLVSNERAQLAPCMDLAHASVYQAMLMDISTTGIKGQESTGGQAGLMSPGSLDWLCFFSFFFFFLRGLVGFELRALCLLGRHSTI